MLQKPILLPNQTVNQPQQYRLGYCEFYKLKFKVTPDVLIPRPETELLVDEVINFIKNDILDKSHANPQDITVCDIGTGAGSIAIAVAKNVPLVKVVATDISSTALKIAQLNTRFHQLERRIKYFKSDLLENYDLQTLLQNTSHLIIVTNLPYIPTQRIAYLDPEVKDFEPHIALDGGDDGFRLYRKLFQQIKKIMIKKPKFQPKFIVGEIDYTHKDVAHEESLKYFPNAFVSIKTDLAYKQRVLTVKF